MGRSTRSYGDPCGVARALDRIGDRWALLVVRELLFGPRRFTDLCAGLVSASRNVLSERLRGLEENGVVQQRVLPPPNGATVYELTPRGRELEPVVMALARWGSRAAPVPRGELSTSALVIALLTNFVSRSDTMLRARFELRLGNESFRIRVSGGRLFITKGMWDTPDATIGVYYDALSAVVLGTRELARVRREGNLTIAGDMALAERFLSMFEKAARRSA